ADLARLHGYGLSSEATAPEAVSVSSAQVYRYHTRFVFPGGARAWPRTTGLPTHGRTQQVGEYPAPSRGPGAAARPGGGGGGAGGVAERAVRGVRPRRRLGGSTGGSSRVRRRAGGPHGPRLRARDRRGHAARRDDGRVVGRGGRVDGAAVGCARGAGRGTGRLFECRDIGRGPGARLSRPPRAARRSSACACWGSIPARAAPASE